MKRILPLLTAVLALFSSCATMLNSPYQKVEITTQKGNTIKIDDEEPTLKKGKYVLARDCSPKQITVEKEGYKTDNYVISQYKRSPLYALSVFPFGITLLPMIYDVGPKAYNYDKHFDAKSRMVKITKKEEGFKDIHLNKVSIDVDDDSLRYRSYFSYGEFITSTKEKKSYVLPKSEAIELENTIFSEKLNEALASNGFIDTTKKVLKFSYSNNLLINATISDITFNVVEYHGYSPLPREIMLFVDLSVKWEVLDYYLDSVYTKVTKPRSGQFTVGADKLLVTEKALKDALDYGFYELMNSEEATKILTDYSQEQIETNFAPFDIPKAKSYVDNLTDAVNATVTIKNKEGHGSGFIISNDGYIITNYHVISDTAGLKVVLHDETEIDAEIVRVSKIHDLALLKTKADIEKPFKLSKNTRLPIGEDIYAIGTPSASDLPQTVSRGIISAIRNTGKNTKLIQTDASINSGNSGGVLCNKKGEVLGVVSSKLRGFGVEGVGFGIPTDELLKSLKIKLK